MRFLTVCKVAVIFDPHFERAQKERLPILTSTDEYENNDIFHKSDTPYREVLPILRLRRSHGMLHTGTKDILLTGYVSTQQLLSQLPASRTFVCQTSKKVKSFALRQKVKSSGDALR